MARNLYDVGDRSPRQSDGWLNEKQDGRTRVLPTGLLLGALLIGGIGYLLLQSALPTSTAEDRPDGVIVISDSFTSCDDPAGMACTLSSGSYAYRGRSYHLSDVSTPSLDDPRCPHEADLARQGRAALVSMMNGGAFETRPDSADADPSARILLRDGVSIGQLLILKGYAKPWSNKPVDWCAQAAG